MDGIQMEERIENSYDYYDDRDEHDHNAHVPVAAALTAASTKHVSNKAYVVLFLFGVATAVGLKYAAANVVVQWFSFKSCGSEVCAGHQIIYRVSCAMTLFFLAMVCATYIGGTFVHDGWWCLKVPMYFALVVGMFLLPGPVFDHYAELSKYTSVLFVLLQIIILIDMAYDIHAYLLDDDGADADRGQKTKYLVLSLSLTCGTIVSVVMLYVFMGSCQLNVTAISANLALGVVTTCVSISSSVGNGLLVPAVVFAYCTYTCWSALSSNPALECNPSPSMDSHNDVGSAAMGAVITVFSLVYASCSTAGSSPHIFRTADKNRVRSSSEDEMEAEAPAPEAHQERHWYFHTVMAMGSMYSAMLLTNWASQTDGAQSAESLWVKLASNWLTYVLYLWTMIAPLVCKSRDFSNRHNQFRA